jgi:hypothetical protein
MHHALRVRPSFPFLASHIGNTSRGALAAGRKGGGGWEAGPPIDAPCTQCLRHGDPMHAQERLTATASELHELPRPSIPGELGRLAGSRAARHLGVGVGVAVAVAPFLAARPARRQRAQRSPP